jgi:hypothetical protein
MIQFNSHSGKQVEQIKSQIGSVNGINKNGVACTVSSHGTYGGKNLKSPYCQARFGKPCARPSRLNRPITRIYTGYA